MMVFPLGLEARTRDFPYATVFILVVTVVYSIFTFKEEAIYAKEYLRSASALELDKSKLQLILANCTAVTSLPAADCTTIQTTLQDLAAENLFEYRSKIQDRLTKNNISKKSLKTFLKILVKEQPDFSKYEASSAQLYSVYKKNIENHEESQKALHKKMGLLSRFNMNIKSLLKGQFTHAGWMHLIGNMVFLIIFGIAVEQHVGMAAFVLIYMVGGFVGLFAHFLWNPTTYQILLGASANVSAIAGAFLVLFRTRRMKVWISMLYVWNRVASLPSWYFIILFVALRDVGGLLSVDTNVANFAHLAGLALGAGAAFIHLKVKPLAPSCVFQFEQEWLLRAHKHTDLEKRLKYLNSILFYHPQNTEALNMLWPTLQQVGPASAAAKNFFENHMNLLFNHYIENKNPDEFLIFYTQLRQFEGFKTHLKDTNIQKLQGIAHHAESLGLTHSSTDLLQTAIDIYELLKDLIVDKDSQAQIVTHIEELKKRGSYEHAVS